MHPPAVAVTVDYGQRASQGELRAAAAVCERLGIPHETAMVRPSLGGGLLVSDEPRSDGELPELWPYRNQLLVAVAAATAAQRGMAAVMIGTVCDDDRYADGRPAFVRVLNRLLRMQEPRVRLLAPAIELAATELVRRSGLPESVAALTLSCSRSDLPCGDCPSCEKARDVRAAAYANQAALRHG
jgi:7-cyano-7-deazaguanine synthase